jgi:hypothetical protein
MSVDPAAALDIPDAVGPLTAILAREDGEQGPETTQTDSAPAEQAEEAAETSPSETAPAEGTGEEEQVPAEEGDAEEAAPEEPQKFTVKVDGAPAEVTLEEALKGYIREQTFTRKSMALADDKKSFEAERQAVTQERAQYAQILPALQQRLEESMPKAPDPKMKDSNPIDYFVLKGEYDERMQQLSAVKQERERLSEVGKKEFESNQQKLMAESAAKLAETIPDWKDPKKGDALRADLRTYAKELGFSDDEISQTYDHRAVMALYEGMKARKLLTAAKPRPLNPGPKGAAPGSAVRTPGRATESTRLKQRLAQTGNVNDAANLLLQSGLVDHT